MKRNPQPDNFEPGRIPPQAIELEEVVLGAMLIEENALTEVIGDLFPEIFYKTEHQKVFTAIKEIYQTSKVDILTVTEQLRKTGELENVGGAYFVSTLTDRVKSSANIRAHIEIIHQKYMMRELIRTGGELIKQGYEDITDCFDLIEYGEQELFKLTPSQRKSCEISDIGRDALEAILGAQQTKTIGIPSGYGEIDRNLGGFSNSDLIVIASRPSMGKTALAMEIVKKVSKTGIPIGVFSLEMSDKQLFTRMLSSESDVSLSHILHGDLYEEELAKINRYNQVLIDLPVYIDDSAALSVFDIRTRARKWKHQKGIQMIVLDYLQLMKGKEGGNREQEVSSISRGLKALAKELDLPVIALSQLSRKCEERSDKRPMLSDLRESGSIEQDADQVIFLYRDSYYNTNADPEKTEIIIGKNRNGKTGAGLFLKFLANCTKFEDYSTIEKSQF